MTAIDQNILATLAYYDIIDRPLTSWEVFRYLSNKGLGDVSISLVDVIQALEHMQLNKAVDLHNGFYYLPNRHGLYKIRINRQKIADQKWKTAKKYLFWLQLVPFIRMVAISGSQAMNNSKAESDIDLLIVAAKNRIWLGRGLVTVLVSLMGRRRHGQITKDRFCLNHYLTMSSLHIPYHSLYNARTYSYLTPVIAVNQKVFARFQQNNNWLRDYLRQYQPSQIGFQKKVKKCVILISFAKIGEFFLDNIIGDKLEAVFRKYQLGRIKKDPLTYKAGGRVVASNDQLEFHPDSPEKNILLKYNEKMAALGLGELGNELDSGLVK